MGLFDDEISNIKVKADKIFNVRLVNSTNISFLKLIRSLYPKDMNLYKIMVDDLSWSIFRLSIEDFINSYKNQEISPISIEEFVNELILPQLKKYVNEVNERCKKPFYHDVRLINTHMDDNAMLCSVWFEYGKKHKKVREFDIFITF